MAEKKIKPSDLDKIADQLIKDGRMPSAKRFLTVIAQVRKEFAHKIVAARKLDEPKDE